MSSIHIEVKTVTDTELEIPGVHTNAPTSCILKAEYRRCNGISCKDCICMVANWVAFKEQG